MPRAGSFKNLCSELRRGISIFCGFQRIFSEVSKRNLFGLEILRDC